MPSMANPPLGAVGNDEGSSPLELQHRHSLSFSEEDDVLTKGNEFGVVPMRRVVSHPTVPSEPLIAPTVSSEDELTMERDLILSDLDEDEEEDDLTNLEGAAPLLRERGIRASSPQQNPLDMSVMAPIPMRRVVSNPTRKRKPPLASNMRFGSFRGARSRTEKRAAPVHSGGSIVDDKESVASGSKWHLTRPYAIRRPRSHPLTSGERSTVAPLLHLSRTHSSSSLSSTASSLAEQEMAVLPAQLTTPKSSKRNLSVFRSNRSSSPSLLLRSGSGMEQAQVLRRSHTDAPPDSESRDARSSSVSFDHLDVSDKAAVAHRRRHSIGGDYLPSSESGGSSRGKILASILQRNSVQYTMYLSTFAIFGFVVRDYVSRFFGFDCEFPGVANDFLTPLSRKICVTATGRTLQTGGALFIELPANMIGSFVMGVMTSLAPDIWPPLPWLREDHPLQRHDALHVAIKTGFCGSLTTFASWNTQMIVMLDGTATELGSQIVPALFGYVLGLFSAIASFIFGSQVSTWLNQWKNPNCVRQEGGVRAMEEGRARGADVDDTERSTPLQSSHSMQAIVVGGNSRPPTSRVVVYPALGISSNGFCHRTRAILNGRMLPFVVLAVILSLFVVADVVWNNLYYRKMWLASLFTPPGVLLRWKLAKWNRTWSSNRFSWVPWGTFAANVLGSVASILLVAIETQYFGAEESNPWTVTVLAALRVGFAGSLSTVSALVKEVVDLSLTFPNQAKAHWYACGTIFTCALLGICLYIPIVNAN